MLPITSPTLEKTIANPKSKIQNPNDTDGEI